MSLCHGKEQKAGAWTPASALPLPFSKEEHGHGWARCCVLPELLPRCGGGSGTSGSRPNSLHCRPVFSIFPLSLLSSFACFNPLKLGKLFNKFLASPELLDVSQLDTLIRPCLSTDEAWLCLQPPGCRQLLQARRAGRPRSTRPAHRRGQRQHTTQLPELSPSLCLPVQ